MKYVYVVQHLHAFPDGTEDVKFIGVYSSELQAKQAVDRLRSVRGFSSHPEGFSIDRYDIDKDHWTEGFVTDS